MSRLSRFLLNEQILGQGELEKLQAAVDAELAGAADRALAAALPGPESAYAPAYPRCVDRTPPLTARRRPCGLTTGPLGGTPTVRRAAAGVRGALWRGPEGGGERISIPDLPSRPRSLRPIADCIGKPDWWERRPGGGAGA